MPSPFRYSKLYPRDASRPTVLKDTSMYTHIAQITSVDSGNGTCSIRWVTPKPGYRQGVLITHGSPGDVTMPSKGDFVLVTFDPFEQARIVGYLNLGHAKRTLSEKTLPELQESERFFECGGSYVWVRANGDVILATADGQFLQLEQSSGTIKSESLNARHTTEACSSVSGIIQRFTKTGSTIENISRVPGGDPLTEMRLKIYETSDTALGLQSLSTPIADICVGTYVSDDGEILDKNDNLVMNPDKELAIRIKLKSGVKIFIDKEGRVSLENVKLNINKASVDIDDPDIVQNLESNNATLGTKGQHVARTHDAVTIPFGNIIDQEYAGLSEKALSNMNFLTSLAAALITPPGGGGPCVFNPALFTGGKIIGEITEGAKDVYLGDVNE